MELGWPVATLPAANIKSRRLPVADIELAALRLCSGPMGLLYNAVLRAAAAARSAPPPQPHAAPELAAAAAATARRFTTTLHAVNSGIIKLSALQPPCTVYRALNPSATLGGGRTAGGASGGLDFGFMGTTLDPAVALSEASGAGARLLQMRLGAASRGAFIGWLAQFPDQCEVLLPPMCSLELLQPPTEGEHGGPLLAMGVLSADAQSGALKTLEDGQ